jgi:hypothetical protein
MLIGYNTNISHKGKQYHVQTEDSGLKSHSIVTLLYHQGAILRSVKTSYAHIIGSPDFEKQLRNIMKLQHREAIKELITGKGGVKLPEDKEEPIAESEEKSAVIPEKSESKKKAPKSLDEILLEHISKKVKNG